MMRSLTWHRGAAVVGLGIVGLGCAGIWREAVAHLFSEMTVDLEQAVPASDSNRHRVQGLIDDGWIAAYEGRLGLTGSLPFSIELDQAIADGVVDPGEVVLLADHAAPFREDLPEAGRRAELMLVKALRDQEERRERGVQGAPGPGGQGPRASGDVPDDLRAALAAAGWQVGSCADRREPGVAWSECEGARGERHARAIVERYDSEAEAASMAPEGAGVQRIGAVVVEVTVADGAAAASLRDALTLGRRGLGELTDRELREGLEGAGWRVSGCETHDGPVERTASCVGVRGEGVAVVDLVGVSGSGGPAKRWVDLGVASVGAGASVLSVSVDDPEGARQLVSALLEDTLPD
jgi:hypothetical protein